MPLFTVGELARRAGVPVHRVTYLIETRDILPEGRAGQARVFSAVAAEQVLAALHQIATERSAAKTSPVSERVASVPSPAADDSTTSHYPL
jgi:DNA-binding transcriptional MerR regulator